MADTLGSIGVIISAGLIKQFGKLNACGYILLQLFNHSYLYV